MANENEVVVETQETSDDANQSNTESQTTDVSVADVEAKIAELQAQLEKQQEIVEKARKGEKYQKNKAESEVRRIQSQYEAEKARADALEQKIRDQAADGALRQKLGENGAKAVDTALKLIDRKQLKFNEDGSVDVESVASAVEALKKSDSILFDVTEQPQKQAQKPNAPPAVRATESDAVSGFAAEVKAAKTKAELLAVLKKYGKA